MGTELDVLVVGNTLLTKKMQTQEAELYEDKFEAD
jgi:hypothetical protein|tara:strand:- start:264 stop:368 length:105 start_codon:yes stop_codon:yes gene_type:complete